MPGIQDDIDKLREWVEYAESNPGVVDVPFTEVQRRILDAIDGGHHQKSHYKPIEGRDPEKRKVIQVTRRRWVGPWQEEPKES